MFYSKGKCRKSLKAWTTKGFDNLAYCGDPASFNIEKNIIEYFKADVQLDSLKIQAILKMDKNI